MQATAAALETSTSELGVAIVRQEVNDLPLNGRNFTQLLALTPGVTTINVSQNSGGGGVWSNPVGDYSYPAINGQTNRSNLFMLDGVNNQGSFGSTYAVAPVLDDIQEFKVQSHNDDASFGGSLGGLINVVTKSGTTQYHGSAWEFHRGASLDALPTFQPEGVPYSFTQNQFGGAGWRADSNTGTQLWHSEDVLLCRLRGVSAIPVCHRQFSTPRQQPIS